jgi:hypothetical protein
MTAGGDPGVSTYVGIRLSDGRGIVVLAKPQRREH